LFVVPAARAAAAAATATATATATAAAAAAAGVVHIQGIVRLITTGTWDG
jgi:hypothetical protein